MTEAKTEKKTKEVKPQVVCWCGCGGLTRGKFVPGHDGRFHGQAKRVARGLMERPSLPHDEAREEFEHHVEKALPTAAAWLAAEAEKVRRREEKAANAAKKEETVTVEETVAVAV